MNLAYMVTSSTFELYRQVVWNLVSSMARPFLSRRRFSDGSQNTVKFKKAILHLLHLKPALYSVIKMRGCYTDTTAHCNCLNSYTMKFHGTKRKKLGEVKKRSSRASCHQGNYSPGEKEKEWDGKREQSETPTWTREEHHIDFNMRLLFTRD